MKLSVSQNPILSAWRQTLGRSGEKAAIRAPSGEVLRNFAEIEAEAFELEELFEHFTPGSAVALQIGNTESWPALLLALFRRDLVPVPIGRHVEAAELAGALHLCGAAALVTIERGALQVARCDVRGVLHQCQFLKLTSGTSCTPRAIRFQAAQILADCSNICETMGLDDRDLNFGVVPFSHSYGFSNLVTPLICRGIPLVVSDEPMPRAILHGIASSGATVFPGMPVFFDKLSVLETDAGLPSLRLCISAGAPLPKSVAAAFHRRYGRKIHTFYGSSECGGIGYDRSPEVAFEDGFAGTPLLGVRIEPWSVEGEQRIAVHGPAVADGYLPEADPETLGGGRFVPDDLVRWSGRKMFIAGRASDTINIAGRKLNPGEIEGRISAFPGVRQVVVFGVPSPLRGEEPVACVAGREVDRAALQRFCQQQLSQWQMPRDFWIVDEIPSNERGKISRRALAGSFACRAEADSSQLPR